MPDIYENETKKDEELSFEQKRAIQDVINNQINNVSNLTTINNLINEGGTRYVNFRCVPATTNTSVTTTVGGDFEIPVDFTIVSIGAYVDTAGTTGTMTVDVNKNGTTIMSATKISIETTEKSSRNAATQPALTTTSSVAGDIITVDIDAIQTTAAKGLTVRFSFT